MAYRISEACISCGSCEQDCPNLAIYEGDDIFIVDPEKCTECVGFRNLPMCAEVCPVAASEPDAARADSYDDLMTRFQRLHPDAEPKGFVLRQPADKPVIALVADGSGDPDGQAALEGLDDFVREQFPGYDVVWAAQAVYMIMGLKFRGQSTYFKRDVPLMTAPDLLKKLHRAGRSKIAMQLFMSGESNFSKNAIQADTFGIDVKYGLPLLAADLPENEIRVVKSLEPVFGDGVETASVMVGHGSDKDFEYNEWFVRIDEYVRENYKNVYMGTLHGPPGADDMVASVQASGCKKVRFVSLMMSRGGHMPLDVINPDNPEAWATRIGLPADMADNFSENPVLREHFTASIRSLLDQFK